MKLNFPQVLRPALASGARGALPLGGGVCWGVTAGKESHNASNARDVTAGKMDATLVHVIIVCVRNNIDPNIEMELAKSMTRVYLIEVLLSLEHFHLVRTMKCGLYTQGQISDAPIQVPLYLMI